MVLAGQRAGGADRPAECGAAGRVEAAAGAAQSRAQEPQAVARAGRAGRRADGGRKAGRLGAGAAQRRRNVRFRRHRGSRPTDPDAASDYRGAEPGAGSGGGGRSYRRSTGAFTEVQGQLRTVGGAGSGGGADPEPGYRQPRQAGIQRRRFVAADCAAARSSGQSCAQPPRRNSLQPGGLNIVGKLLALFKSRLFITLVGLLLLLVIVVIWAVWLQIQQMRVRGKAKQMASDLSDQGAPAAGGERNDRASSERAQLQGRFQEAVDTLRKNRSGGTNLYALPWYVVIGPPGSGKSTLLQNSGLNFPLSNKFGKEAIRGVGGTRNCDWWFTDEAVFLDTAGRYTTQDSDRSADASAWTEFLNLLRKYRKRRPINGVIVAMSVSDLLTLDEAGRQQHILAIRQRLDELAKHLRIGVPAYLVFTKCDLVAGFTEFFDDLTPELRSQVWGVSFPVDQTMAGTAAKQFLEEFNLLLERLNTRVLDRLHRERDRLRRAAILSFPQQLGALRDITRQFVEGVFTGAARCARPSPAPQRCGAPRPRSTPRHAARARPGVRRG